MRSQQNRDADDLVKQRAEDIYKVFLTELEKRGLEIQEIDLQATGEHRIKAICGISLEIDFGPESNRGGSWYRMYRDKVRIQVGHWEDGRRKQFPEPKEGFDWEKIIDYIEENMKQRRAKLDVKAREKANYDSAEAEIGKQLDHYDGLNVRLAAVENSLTGPRIKISFNTSFSPAETEDILSLLSKELSDLLRK